MSTCLSTYLQLWGQRCMVVSTKSCSDESHGEKRLKQRSANKVASLVKLTVASTWRISLEKVTTVVVGIFNSYVGRHQSIKAYLPNNLWSCLPNLLFEVTLPFWVGYPSSVDPSAFTSPRPRVRILCSTPTLFSIYIWIVTWKGRKLTIRGWVWSVIKIFLCLLADLCRRQLV